MPLIFIGLPWAFTFTVLDIGGDPKIDELLLTGSFSGPRLVAVGIEIAFVGQ